MQNFIRERKVFLDNYNASDLHHFENLLTDPDSMKYTGGPKSAETIEKLFIRFLNPQNLASDLIFAIRNENNDYIGHAALFHSNVCKENEREILFYILKSYWGHGYATEVGRLLLKVAFIKENFYSVLATLDTDHFASIKVCEKIGMKLKKIETDPDGEFLIYTADKA